MENFYITRTRMTTRLDGTPYEDSYQVLVATLPDDEGIQFYNVTLTGEEYFEFCQWLNKK